MTDDRPLITKSRLVSDLRALGLQAGQVVMLHVSVKAIGWIVGGPEVVLDALLEVLTPAGTLMMYVSCEGGSMYGAEEWPEEQRQAYLEECPPFIPESTHAYRKWSILTEYLRLRPGARRSANPEWSMAAVGAQAEWLTRDHPLQHGAGPGSPLEKLVRAGGKVLLLGSPISDVTVLHYAEYLAEVPGKRLTRYQVALLVDGRREWVWVEEHGDPALARWPEEEYFSPIVQGYLDSGRGRAGKVGAAQSHLLEAPELVNFAARWMERELGEKARRHCRTRYGGCGGRGTKTNADER